MKTISIVYRGKWERHIGPYKKSTGLGSVRLEVS